MPPALVTLQEEWKALLPSDVVVVAGPISDTAPPLTSRECKSVGAVAPVRMLELRAGRKYAKQALSTLGIGGVELLVLADRSPAWPSGTTGSITHVRGRHGGHCAVAVGLTAQFDAIGIDFEYRHTVPRETWSTFLTVRELAQIQAVDESSRQADVLCRWCVKESIIKASGCRFDPLAIETEESDIKGQWLAFGTAAGGRWSVKSSRAEKFFMAAVAVPA